ncbi:MAG: nitroreductase family protein [Turicibacter sp.]|nr:nitroreductase family protein [Turicibacter sp.]
MEAIEMIKGRRSIRKYKDEVVDRDVMTEIIDITRHAPSWTNSQTPRWTLVDDAEVIAKFAEDGVKGFAYNIATLKNARGVAVLSFVEGRSGRTDKYDIETSENPGRWESFDAGIACQTFCLAAHAKGVGTCIFGVIDEPKIAELVALPEGEKVASLVVYGYPDEEPKMPRRKEVDDLLRFV